MMVGNAIRTILGVSGAILPVTAEEAKAFAAEQNRRAKEKQREDEAQHQARLSELRALPRSQAAPRARLDTRSIYRGRTAAGAAAKPERPAAGTPRTLAQIAASVYGGGRQPEDVELIASTGRGGGR